MGDVREVNGVLYTKRDRAALDALVTPSPDTDEVELARSCTTGVTDMSELFGEALGSKVSDPATFNPDLSSWDTSSVTTMKDMFAVRRPPSRSLLLFVSVSCAASLGDHRPSLHTTIRPSLRHSLPLPSIKTSVNGTRAWWWTCSTCSGYVFIHPACCCCCRIAVSSSSPISLLR